MNHDDSVSDLSLEGISNVGLDELDVAVDGITGKERERKVLRALAHTSLLVVSTDVGGGVGAGDGTDEEGQVLLVDGVDVVAGEEFGGAEEDISGADGHGDGGEGEESGNKVHGVGAVGLWVSGKGDGPFIQRLNRDETPVTTQLA